MLPADGPQAQTASEVTPPSLAPETQRLTGAVVFTGAPGLGTPEGADRLSVRIAAVDVAGAFPALADAHAALEARLAGRTVRVSEIFTAAQDLEAAYAEAGFVLVRVVLPAQELRDGGTLRLQIVDGFVEEIETESVPAPVRDHIQRVTAPLQGPRGLRLSEIERALLIAGDTLGVALDSALATGEAPGATRLVLGGDFRPVTGFVGIDGSLSRALGRFSLQSGVELNSPFGMAETIYFRLSGNPTSGGVSDGFFSSRPRLRTVALGVLAPVGTQGLVFNAELTDSRTAPRSAVLPSASRFQRASLRLAFPVVRSRPLTVTGRVAFDAQNDTLEVFPPGGVRTPQFRDSLRVLRLGGSLLQIDPGGRLMELGATASLGLDGLGAGFGAAGPSRAGARTDFARLELTGRLVQPLGESLVGALSFRGQTAFGQTLPTSEQIGIAGPGELSGFAAGAVSGDSGAVLRGELRAPFEVNGEGMSALMTPYVFAAGGVVRLQRPLAGEFGRARYSSLGLGMEILPMLESRFTSATLRVEYARGIDHRANTDDDRLTLVGTMRF